MIPIAIGTVLLSLLMKASYIISKILIPEYDQRCDERYAYSKEA